MGEGESKVSQNAKGESPNCMPHAFGVVVAAAACEGRATTMAASDTALPETTRYATSFLDIMSFSSLGRKAALLRCLCERGAGRALRLVRGLVCVRVLIGGSGGKLFASRGNGLYIKHRFFSIA
jgi:hypothetical protein